MRLVWCNRGGGPVRTRYTWINLTILTTGTLVCAALIPYTGWVFS